MKRLATILIAVVVVSAAGITPAASGVAGADRMTLVGLDGTTFQIGNRTYAGPIELTAYPQGIAVVEVAALDDYLAGIREVPFSWPAETLAAQAVAARTYLAWTLVRGRIGSGARFDFDICATTLCQVYAGAGVSAGPDGDRWLDAVARTSGEVLVYDGVPAQTLYSSSAGSRTRANQDIWGGEPKPYLQPVASPEQDVTPYAIWEVEFTTEAFGRIVRLGGYDVGGSIRAVTLERTPEGAGPSRVLVTSEEGVASISIDRFRWIFNDRGPALYPGSYPATRPGGGRWPQTILSYTFEIDFDLGPEPVPIAVAEHLPPGDLPERGSVTVIGEGWGHGIGMSQWGAKAMGDTGATYEEILAHYYGGLRPQDGGSVVPDRVRVGLAVEQAEVTVVADGPFRVVLDGVLAGTLPAGGWRFPLTNRGIDVVVPVGLEPAIIEIFGRVLPR